MLAQGAENINTFMILTSSNPICRSKKDLIMFGNTIDVLM